jgi:hypothetical protein
MEWGTRVAAKFVLLIRTKTLKMCEFHQTVAEASVFYWPCTINRNLIVEAGFSGCLSIFIFVYVMLVFSLLFTTAPAVCCSCSIQYTVISALVTLDFSLSQHYYFRLNYFRIYFLDNKIEKVIV